MNQQLGLLRISQLLSRFSEQVKILNSNGELSINIQAETILRDVLGLVYGCQFVNLNHSVQGNYASIDLGDENSKVAVQVTSSRRIDKVKRTIEKFLQNKENKKYKKLFVFIITEKQRYYDPVIIGQFSSRRLRFKADQIHDRTDIYKILSLKNDPILIQKVVKLLESQFADDASLNKWEIYSKGLVDYDKFISSNNKYLDIRGFSPRINNNIVKIGLEQIYIPIALSKDQAVNEAQKLREEQIDSIMDVLQDMQRIVVLGDPGSGKSTTLKHLAYEICTFRNSERLVPDLVPVFIKASEYAKFYERKQKPFGEYIINHLDRKYEDLFLDALENGRLLILLDGLDEIVKSKVRFDIVDKVNAFVSQYPEICLIATSRIVGYNESRLNSQFIHLKAEPFVEKQIESFVKNWYTAIHIASESKDDSSSKNAADLIKAINSNKSVQRMATNPLLITIIALIHYQGMSLPEKRAELYEISTSTFLDHWVKQRETKTVSNFEKDTIIEILSPVSYFIHETDSTGLIVESELRKRLLEQYKRKNPSIAQKDLEKDIKTLVDFLREDAGFLFEKGRNESGEALFGFVHLTFQEFFASIEFRALWEDASDQGKNLQLLEHIFHPNWQEVITLTASLFKLADKTRIGRKNTTKFVKAIWDIEDPYPEFLRAKSLVAKILIDEIEVEDIFALEVFDFFISLLVLLNENSENRKVNDKKHGLLVNFVSQLLGTKVYQDKYLRHLLSEISMNKYSDRILVVINPLMKLNSSDLAIDILQQVLKSKGHKFYKEIFSNTIFFPTPRVYYLKSFVAYFINYIEDLGSEKLDTSTIISFILCISSSQRSSKGMLFWGIEDRWSLTRFVNFIDILKSIHDLGSIQKILSLYFSILSPGFSYLPKYVDILKKGVPEIDPNTVLQSIEQQRILNKNNLEVHPSIRIHNRYIHRSRTNPELFAAVPFGKMDINFHNIKDAKNPESEFWRGLSGKEATLLNFLIENLETIEQNRFIPQNKKELFLLIDLEGINGWRYGLSLTGMTTIALQYLFKENSTLDSKLLNWLLLLPKRAMQAPADLKPKNRIELEERIELSGLSNSERLTLHVICGNKESARRLVDPSYQELLSEKNPGRREALWNVLSALLQDRW